ncbi:Citron homology (CNH) domain - like 1 [Theobroma cacao]|nr:Citron homology (CNH) domain - like 1 [Theobroma cacao]
MALIPTLGKTREASFALPGKRECVFSGTTVKDFGVPDTVKSMSWCGENICLGIRKEYMILNATNGVLSEVFSSGKIAPPLVVALPSGELILGKENIGVFVDQNGKLLQADRICWSEAPAVVVIQRPYAIALLTRRVEIRFLRVPYPLIQTIVLQNARHLIKSNNAVIVALENSVCGLFPVPLGAQIVQLTAYGNFEEALALCKLLPPEDASLRAAKEGSIHIRYAHYLFDNGCYEEAMEHFLASQIDITYVLTLYPSIVLPKTTTVPEPEKLLDLSLDASQLSRGSSGLSDDLETFFPQSSESDENAALEFKKMSHNTLMALIKFLQKKRFSVLEKAAAEGTEEVVLDAVGDDFTSARFKKSNKVRGSIPINSAAREMAAILDTALLQALLLTGQSSVALELLKCLNYCDVKIFEEILQKGNHYAALLELYRSNSMHREALKLLHQLAELIQKFSAAAIIEYLKPLCGTDPMLVLEFSMLVLESCPTETIELFLSGNIPADLVNSYLKQRAPNMQGRYLELMLVMNENGISGNLQNEMVQIYLSEVLEWYTELSAQQIWDENAYLPTRKKLLSALESISGYNLEGLLRRLPPDALFEERAILLGKMNQHELALSLYVHKLHVPELALAYCDRVYESVVHQLPVRSSGNIYLTLLQIYLNSQKTTKNFENRITNLVSSPNTSIPKFGSAASIKGKGGRKKIASIEGAEDIRISPSNTDSGRSDGDAEELGEEGVFDLLSRRWDRINGAQALKLLPRETKLENLLPFLGPLPKKSSEAYRNFSVIKSLRQSENLLVKDELYSQRKAVVKISSDSMCSLCNKKIGTSVFAVYPNGKTLVHFVCFRDSQSMKAVAKGSPIRKR